MELEIVVPVTRPWLVDRMLRSFALGSLRPGGVLLVSNELPATLETHGLSVCAVEFESDVVPYGDRDVVVRRNVGIWAAGASHVLLFDDDQIAPHDLVESMLALLGRKPYVWGHHRYLSFAGRSVDELVHLPPEHGREREHPPNAWHSWMSCYGGMFGFERALVRSHGGFDMAFNGRHANEDQQLGRRLARRVDNTDRIFVPEPPFAWHPLDFEPWGPARGNVCTSAHEWRTQRVSGYDVRGCGVCPAFVFDEAMLKRGDCLMPYDPSQLTTRVRSLEPT